MSIFTSLVTFCVWSIFLGNLCFLHFAHPVNGYEPTWESLDSRPLPEWFDDAKVGIFIHWGVFSVPSYKHVWFWYEWKAQKNPDIVKFMEDNYRPDFTYADFAKDFTAEFFNADQWAELFNSSGAKYVVFVSKHHEGFTNWPSKYSFNWNSMDVGPKRDIVGELATAVRKYNSTGMKFGLYHSLYEWFHPLYLKDKASGYKTQDFVNKKTMPELYEIVNKYKPELVWSDGEWEASSVYWKSKEFLAWLYTNSSVKDTVIVNDRWGNDTKMKHGGGYYTDTDRFNPGILEQHKFENSMTIDRVHWGFNREAKLSDFLSIEELLQTMVLTVSCGGNILMNVGPPKYGHIQPIYEERLRQMGQWMNDNSEGIYRTKPWRYQNEYGEKIWYTMKKKTASTVYAFLFSWPPEKLTLFAPSVTAETEISMLGYKGGALSFTSRGDQGVDIIVPPIPISQLPNTWLWTLKITNVSN